VALYDGGDQHDESPGRAADLKAAAAKRGDDEAADNRRVEPAIRRESAGNGNGHRERQGHDRHRQPGDGIATQILQAVTFAPGGQEFRFEMSS
jgi:hypothetical protein